jgi:predicted nucleic acid-binding Zn ribbon protein
LSAPQKLGALLRSWNPRGQAARQIVTSDQNGAELAAAWENAVGGAIAQRSRPARFRSGVLTVLTASSAWSAELSFLTPVIIEALRRAVPEANVQRLRFMVASGRTKLLLEGQRFRGHAPSRAHDVHPRAATKTKARDEDLNAALARLACEQRSLDQWRDRSGWKHCTTCGRRFWPATQNEKACAPCGAAKQLQEQGLVEVLLAQAPWLSAGEIRQSVPALRPTAYRRARQHLLTRWELEVAAAERRLRRGALTADDRRAAWSYLMLVSGMPKRDVGRAVVRDVLGALWANALCETATCTKREARTSVREKHL